MNQPVGPETRIGDADREAAVSALGEHYAAGRLTKEEYDERADHAYAARTASALWPLFADLPRPQAHPSAGRPTARPTRGDGPLAGWRFGAVLGPILVVLLVVTVLTHLPVILLVLLAWFFLARSGRRWGRTHGRHGSRDWVR